MKTKTERVLREVKLRDPFGCVVIGRNVLMRFGDELHVLGPDDELLCEAASLNDGLVKIAEHEAKGGAS